MEDGGAGGVGSGGEVTRDLRDPLLRLCIGVRAGVVYSTSPTCDGTSTGSE